MRTVQDNISRVQTLLDKVKNHPLCLTLEIQDHYFLVIFPDGDLPSGGIRISKKTTAGGQAFSLEILYLRLEKIWYETTPYGIDSLNYKTACQKLEKLMEEWRSK